MKQTAKYHKITGREEGFISAPPVDASRSESQPEERG